MEKVNGLCHREEMTVTGKDLASALGSGDLDVFGTPALVAFMEYTCRKSVEEHLKENETTVGISVACEHLKASAEGAVIKCLSCVQNATEKVISFTVEVYEGEKLIGKGTHERAVIDRERFMTRVRAEASDR